MAIVLATGSGVGKSCDSKSAVRPMMLPVSNDAGSMILWDDVLKAARAMWGAMIPTKPSGPQNAVAAPVSMQLLRRADCLIWFAFAPASSAYSSPNMMMSSPFLPRNDMTPPMMSAPAIMAICGHVVTEKLPADQL